MVKKVSLGGSESRGLRMPKGVWGELDRLSKIDRRKTSQYILLLFENHITEKNKRNGKEKAGS